MGWEGLTEGFLPSAVAADQLPKQIVRAGKEFSVGIQPIFDGEQFLGALLVVSDTTAESRTRRESGERAEIIQVFERATQDRYGVVEFLDEVDRLVRGVTADWSPVEGARALHTVKGNCAIFGVASIADYCHEIEEAIAEGREIPQLAERLHHLDDVWKNFRTGIAPLLGFGRGESLEIGEADYAHLLMLIRESAPRHQIESFVEGLKWEPVALRCKRMAERALNLAERLGKAPVDVVIEADTIRLPPERWVRFWAAFVHGIRNSVDHGLESSAEREAAGKAGNNRLTLRARLRGPNLRVEVEDDGHGVAWEKIRNKARASGLRCETHDELVTALCFDGITALDRATETSGRGVGMSALHASVTEMGGRIEVISSKPGGGTLIRCTVPLEAAEIGFTRASLPPPSSFEQRSA